jgi:hypothetical protein
VGACRDRGSDLEVHTRHGNPYKLSDLRKVRVVPRFAGGRILSPLAYEFGKIYDPAPARFLLWCTLEARQQGDALIVVAYCPASGGCPTCQHCHPAASRRHRQRCKCRGHQGIRSHVSDSTRQEPASKGGGADARCVCRLKLNQSGLLSAEAGFVALICL